MEACATRRHSSTPFLHRVAVADASFTACVPWLSSGCRQSPGAAYREAEPRRAGAVRQPQAEQQDVGEKRRLLKSEQTSVRPPRLRAGGVRASRRSSAVQRLSSERICEQNSVNGFFSHSSAGRTRAPLSRAVWAALRGGERRRRHAAPSLLTVSALQQPLRCGWQQQ